MTAIQALTCDNETDRRGAGNAPTALTHLTDLSGRGLGVSLPIEEEWRPVLGYEGIYEVSNLARVRSWHRRRPCILRPWLHANGYRMVSLRANGSGSHAGLHRLVATAFIPNTTDAPLVRHLNGDPTDNRIENLAWGTQTENMHDMIQHGRHRRIEQTHCKNGHLLAETANHYQRKSGQRPGVKERICRVCQARLIPCPTCGLEVRRDSMLRHQRSVRCHASAQSLAS